MSRQKRPMEQGDRGTWAVLRRWMSRILCLAMAAIGIVIGMAGYRTWVLVTAGGRVPLQVRRLVGLGEPRRIGIIVGHWESDSGAVCGDGLREVDINQDVAQRVQKKLSRLGYQVELLPEFAVELGGYEADVLLSLHADSCLPHRSGFKVARVASSAIPVEEDRLVACLSEAYAGQTGLAFDAATITRDMVEYHAFFKIAPTTPAAIIELGFMGGDRFLLTWRTDAVARGVAAGLVCFLEQTE